MPSRPHLLTITALAVAPALLMTACGSDAEGSRTTIAEVQTTSYVVQPPATTTTTTTTVAAGPNVPGQTVPGEQSYTVQGGDSVYKIASSFGIAPDVLANYNSWPEGVAHPLFVGDIVKIPPGSQAAGSGDSGDTGTSDATSTDTGPEGGADTTLPTAEGVGCEHTVVAGDNPSRLAEQYEVTLDELNAVNANNSAYGHFQLGSTIHIPANGACP
jgi:LysM repeat protein